MFIYLLPLHSGEFLIFVCMFAENNCMLMDSRVSSLCGNVYVLSTHDNVGRREDGFLNWGVRYAIIIPIIISLWWLYNRCNWVMEGDSVQ